MKTKTESATKPEQDKNDEDKSVKNGNVSDVTNIEGDEERSLSVEERKGLAGFKRMSNRLLAIRFPCLFPGVWNPFFSLYRVISCEFT